MKQLMPPGLKKAQQEKTERTEKPQMPRITQQNRSLHFYPSSVLVTRSPVSNILTLPSREAGRLVGIGAKTQLRTESKDANICL